MQFHISTFVQFFGLSLVLLGAFALIGLPVKVLLRASGTRIGRAVPAPVIGIALLAVASWYWTEPFGATKPLARWTLVIGTLVAVAVAIWLVIRRERLVAAIHDPVVRTRVLLAVLCFAGLAAVTVVENGQLFARTHATVLSTAGNNDAASYALEAQHMMDRSPDDPGGIVGFDAGFRSQQFSTGAYAALAGSASVTGQDVWKIMQPALFVALVLGAYATALLLLEILGNEYLIAIAIISVGGFSVLYVAYVAGNWFYSQLLTVALVTAVTAVLFAASRAAPRRDRAGAVGLIGLMLAGGFAIYPHMTVMGTLVLLPVSCIVHDSFRHLARRTAQVGIVVAAGFVLASAVGPGLLASAIRITGELEDVEAGWPLPRILPTAMVGFQTSVIATHSWLSWLTSLLLVVGLVAIGVMLWRRGFGARVAPLGAAMIVILLSYAVIYESEGGPTYRQWKWITFFIPLFVACVLALIVVACFSLARDRDVGRRLGYVIVALQLGIAVAFVAGSTAAACNGSPPVEGVLVGCGASAPLGAGGGIGLTVNLDQIDLRSNPRLADRPRLHLETGPYWDTMWLAYFLRDKQLSLAPPTYYSTSDPVSRWSIERTDTPLDAGTTAVPLNSTYRLVRER